MLEEGLLSWADCQVFCLYYFLRIFRELLFPSTFETYRKPQGNCQSLTFSFLCAIVLACLYKVNNSRRGISNYTMNLCTDKNLYFNKQIKEPRRKQLIYYQCAALQLVVDDLQSNKRICSFCLQWERCLGSINIKNFIPSSYSSLATLIVNHLRAGKLLGHCLKINFSEKLMIRLLFLRCQCFGYEKQWTGSHPSITKVIV